MIVNYNDLTATEPWKILVNKGNHPLLWPEFRLVNYCNLPRDDGRWYFRMCFRLNSGTSGCSFIPSA